MLLYWGGGSLTVTFERCAVSLRSFSCRYVQFFCFNNVQELTVLGSGQASAGQSLVADECIGDKYCPASVDVEIRGCAVTKVGAEPEQEQQVTSP